MLSADRQMLIAELKERLGRVKRSKAAVSTGLEALDRLLPGAGLEAGTMIEWLSEGAGTGTATLALILAARVLEKGGVFLVIDGQREFYPPAAIRLGIPLERTILVQPRLVRDALWALEQSLRCGTVALSWVNGMSDRALRRLQLAAEQGEGLGFLLRPATCRTEPSWAEARFLVEALPSIGPGQSWRRRLRVELLHRRGGVRTEAIELELSDEEGVVHLASELAHPAPLRSAAQA